MKKVTVYYVIEGDGAGSAYIRWFLTQKDAENFEDNMEEGWGDSTVGSVETFEGSDIYNEASNDMV